MEVEAASTAKQSLIIIAIICKMIQIINVKYFKNTKMNNNNSICRLHKIITIQIMNSQFFGAKMIILLLQVHQIQTHKSYATSLLAALLPLHHRKYKNTHNSVR